MKLSDAREQYYAHSGAASAAARQLAFAGIAVVWILATEKVVVAVNSSELRLPLLAFVATLGLDLIHYYWQATFWGIFSRSKEKKGDREFEGAPDWGNRVGISCWAFKGLTVTIGYLWLLNILWPVLFKSS